MPVSRLSIAGFNSPAFETHIQTPHLKKWVAMSKNWHAEPEIIYKATTIFPDDSYWKNR